MEPIVKLTPLILDLSLSLLLDTLFLLSADCELFEFTSVHLHISSYHGEGDCSHTLIPMLLLGTTKQSFDYNWVSIVMIGAHYSLDQVRIEEHKGPFGRWVMHSLRRLQQLLKQRFAIL